MDIRQLCAPCIADIANNPMDIDITQLSDGASITHYFDQKVAMFEAFALGKPEHKVVSVRDRMAFPIVAVTTINGVPNCVRHAAARNWR